MQIPLGFNAGRNVQNQPVVWDHRKMVNPHICILGMTGAGKSYNLRKVVESLARTNDNPDYHAHVFDVHGDLHFEQSSEVLFSEQTQYGLNPLEISPNPHFGGVRKKTRAFLQILGKTSRTLGEKQEGVLRHLIYDTYSNFGFDMDKPETWTADKSQTFVPLNDRFYIDVPFAEKEDASALGARWDPEQKSWWVHLDDYKDGLTRWPPKHFTRAHPTINDVLRYAKHINRCTFIGANSEACSKLEIVHKRANNFIRKRLKEYAAKGSWQDEKTADEVEKAKVKAIEAFTEYVNSVASGREIDQLLKYDSSDVLASVVNRLENLNAIGIFKTEQPPFDPKAPIWRYNIRALGIQERSMFILFKCQELFEQALQRGETDKIYDTIVIDEAHIVLDDDPDNILNKISLEGRKFGLQLVFVTQSPEHIPKDTMTTMGTKIILGLDEILWKPAINKMNVTLKSLEWIILQKRFLVQMKTIGEAQSQWTYAYFQPIHYTNKH